jgi:hypothetical protein
VAPLDDDQDARPITSLEEVPGTPGYRRPQLQNPTPEPAAPEGGTPAADPAPRRRLRRLTCCVCGDLAPAFQQWWNRDTGYGLCPACANWLRGRPDYDPEEFRQLYGEEGIHWFWTMPEGLGDSTLGG